ncbi:MAG: ClpXP protease specificity-enhancing factor SspB [Myxococcales bacterium]
MNTTPLPAKKDVARALLLRGSVFIHLDPRRSGVLVPARLRSQAQVVLQVGLDMPVPIPDLRIDQEGVFGTLSFKGVPFACFVPWGAVFALVGEDAKGMVWHADMPAEIAAEVEREGRKRAGGSAELVELDAFRAARPPAPEPGRFDVRRSGAVAKRKSDRPPAWDRPSYLRVVK